MLSLGGRLKRIAGEGVTHVWVGNEILEMNTYRRTGKLHALQPSSMPRARDRETARPAALEYAESSCTDSRELRDLNLG